MRKTTVIAIFGALIFFGATATGISAAKPAVTGCFGQSVSAESVALGSAAGQEIAGLAQDNTGVGGIVQQIQAGNVPDTVFQNSCND
ncbi:MAG: hypothetical protein M3P30_08320 [Chloroflexota bacterium]|nr:hypothetical protein [Chloroflexota bacterium]